MTNLPAAATQRQRYADVRKTLLTSPPSDDLPAWPFLPRVPTEGGTAVAARAGILHLVLRTTAEYFHLDVEHLTGPRRYGPLVRARKVYSYLCAHLTGRSYPNIARVMGDKDHTTILHHVHDVKNLMRRRSAGETLSAHSLTILKAVDEIAAELTGEKR